MVGSIALCIYNSINYYSVNDNVIQLVDQFQDTCMLPAHDNDV